MARLAVSLITCVLVTVGLSWAQRDACPEKALIDALLKSYSPKARPVQNHNDTVHVYIGFAFIGIFGVKEDEQRMTSIGTIRIEWIDPFLTWNSSDYADIESVYLPMDTIWTPDIIHLNSVGSTVEPIQTEGVLVKLYNNGSITWMTSGLFQSACDVDITYFPFDKQSCTLVIGSNVYDSEHVEISLNNAPRSSFRDASGEFLNNNQWEALSENSSLFTTPNKIRNMAIFTAHLRRRSRYFVMNILFPSFVLTIVNLFVFLVPYDLSDKVGVSTTLVLAYVMFLIQVTDSAPSNSDQIPFVTTIILVMMSISALDVILSILILRCLKRSIYGPPPGWLLRIIPRLPRKDNPDDVSKTSNTDNEISADPSKKLTEQEIWQEQWVGVGKTIDKAFMATQTIIILSLYASIICIYIMQK